MSLRRRRGTDSPAPFFVPCRTFVSLCAGLIAFLHMWAGAGIIMHCEVSHARPGLRAIPEPPRRFFCVGRILGVRMNLL